MSHNLLAVFIAWDFNLYFWGSSLHFFFFVHSSLDFARDFHMGERAVGSARGIAWEIGAKDIILRGKEASL